MWEQLKRVVKPDAACVLFSAQPYRMYKFYVDGNGDLSYVYEYRINRDLTTIEYLRKSQECNSRLINKHRVKIKSLRSELQELKNDLSVLKGEKE